MYRMRYIVLLAIVVFASCKGSENGPIMPTSEDLKETTLGKQIEGKWVSYSSHTYKEEDLEFFNDGACMINAESDQLACKWSVLSDQRVKIEMSLRGDPHIALATGRDDFLTFGLTGESVTYVRADSRSALSIQRRVAANKLYQQSNMASEQEERQRLLLEAAEAGSPDASYALGVARLHGHSGFEQDVNNAIDTLDSIVQSQEPARINAANALASWFAHPENKNLKKASLYARHLLESETLASYQTRAFIAASKDAFQEAIDLQERACVALATQLRQAGKRDQSDLRYHVYGAYSSLELYKSNELPIKIDYELADLGVGYIPQLPAKIRNLKFFEGSEKKAPPEDERAYKKTLSSQGSIYWSLNLSPLGNYIAHEPYELKLEAELIGPSNRKSRSNKAVWLSTTWKEMSIAGVFNTRRRWQPGAYKFLLKAQGILLASEEIELK